MATAAKINIKNIDYFKFKKIVIDGNRDDYASCSKEVKSLCDSVQTLSFRDDEFDDLSDRTRFEEINICYRQILSSKRIDPTDMRIKNGWWVDANAGNVCSAGKFKPGALKDTLVAKTRDWISRHGATSDLKPESVPEKLEGPGLYIFKHKEHQCFQYVGKSDKIFSRCAEKLKAAFDGTLSEPLAALLIISMASDWDFYFIPVKPNDGADILRILENDVILKHDCIWPHGLNFSLHIDSLLEVAEFRKSCLRHRWPPETDTVDEAELSLDRLRRMEKSRVERICAVDADAGSIQTVNGIERESFDVQSPSDPTPRLPVSTGKAPTENGQTNETHRPTQPSKTEHSELSKKSAVDKKQANSATASLRKIARPASAPKPPPPKQSSTQGPVLSKDNARKADGVTQRSLDADGQRGSRVKSSGTRQGLERPRSSLDGRQEIRVNHMEETHKTAGKVPDGAGGMTRSRSVSSTTSIDSKEKATSDKMASAAAAGKGPKEASKTSGIKAPAVQVAIRQRPSTAKQKPVASLDVAQEVITTL